MHKKVLIIGTNDIATSCALRLFRSGFSITMISPGISGDLYYFRNYSTVLVSGSQVLANIKAQSHADFSYNLVDSDKKSLEYFVAFSLNNRQIAVLSPDDFQKIQPGFDYCIICDALLTNTINLNRSEMTFISCVSTTFDFCQYQIILHGPAAGQVNYPFLDYDTALIENREEFIYATEEAVFVAEKSAGEKVFKDERIATLGESEVKANRNGYIDGIMRSGVIVAKGQVIAAVKEEAAEDIRALPLTAVNISGGVLEAVMYDMHINEDE